ncbi:hypothetical protein CMI37_05890 [Candidatus Pacearchaeota archaeon]|nr:hypothetical protein [Candidatus Pacearchaeota archaeon]|tara:strand:- start:2438 stop:2752 length:315 start_codon:yes stop_codon:yes gene_type:complete
MLIELYMFFQLVVLGVFISAFFTKQEILWVLTLVLSGVLMMNAYNVETQVYSWNTTIEAYQPEIITHSYPYLMGINMLIFGLTMVLGLFDLFDKYGRKIAEGGP